MLVQLVHDKTYVPMKLKELAMLLSVPKEQRDELKEVLDILIAEGKIGISKKGKYGKAEEFALAGTFSGHAKGFGFVTIEGREQDVFIPADKTKGAMDGDKVQIVIESEARGKRAEGAVLRILEHANKTVIGFYQKNKNFGFVLPDNQKLGQDIFIPQGKDMGAVTGHKVIVRITDFGDDRKKPEGVITEILGHVNDPGVDILSIIKAYGLPEGFPDEVMVQVAGIPDEVEEEEKKNRLDLRHLQTVTIDGEDAKDLDDAISISKENDDHYTLGVHIADVSHYVTENSPLDKEALKRGTSVYLVDRVIPMLPHKLSNGICSLNAGTDRLALSCLMEIDGKGNVIGHRIAETLIQVDRRMTYTAVNAIVTDRDPDVMEEYRDFVPMFDLMKELADILRERRKKRGSIDFDFPESKIILDEKGRPVDIKPYERNAATKIIEDFMLMANETIAEDYFWQELPFLYRTHDYPDPEKMKRLGTFINNFGYTIRTQNGEVHPKELQKLLDKIEGTPEEALISRLTLRSMKQAKYTTVCTGHFGLAANYYTHFTSPIRRYPDLQIHRIIKENLRRGLSDRRFAYYDSILPEVAVQCSSMERRADEAERETDKLKKCEYMSKRIGKEYDGVISGVTNWGLYVELPNTVEGLIRVNDLTGDYFVFDEEHMELVGEMTRKSYKLGQKIRVQVADTDKLTRTIDFIPAKWQEEDE
ncbi:ribonuclease R [Lachnospiraceae bacterium HCP1S3_A8]|nr:ribonuclease R [Lachnospiraceae bacterium]